MGAPSFPPDIEPRKSLSSLLTSEDLEGICGGRLTGEDGCRHSRSPVSEVSSSLCLSSRIRVFKCVQDWFIRAELCTPLKFMC